MLSNKFVPTDLSVERFLNAVSDERRREDAFAMLRLMIDVTGLEPQMWATVVGFGSLHYKYESGREGDTILIGFSPRKSGLSLHIAGLHNYGDLLTKLGKHTTGKACLYINRLSDIDLPTLKRLLEVSFEFAKRRRTSSQ